MSPEPETAALYSLLADHTTEMISRHRPEDRVFQFASPASRRVLGYAPEELVGRTLDELVEPDDLEAVLAAFAAAGEAGGRGSVSFRAHHKQGHMVWLESTHRLEPAKNGRGAGVLAVSREITRFKELERAIEKVAQEWRATFDAASDVIILLDDQRRIARANRAAVTFFGRPFGELLWQPVTDLLAELRPRGSLRLPDLGKLRRRFEREVYLERPQTWVLLSLDPIRDPAGKPAGAVHLIRDITERKRAEIAVRESLDQLRNLSARLEAAREQERTRIAREIHDQLGHALTVLKMDSAWIAERAGGDAPDLAERARAMSTLIERTIGTIRQIATELRPSILDDLGLLAALEWEAGEFGRRTGIRTRVRGPSEPLALDDEHATAVFRIFQEALTNVARHAGATSVRATLSKAADAVSLEVTDDGRGFEPSALANPRSLGIVGMRERARMLGGTLSLEGRPGQGARLRVTIPLGEGGAAS